MWGLEIGVLRLKPDNAPRMLWSASLKTPHALLPAAKAEERRALQALWHDRTRSLEILGVNGAA